MAPAEFVAGDWSDATQRGSNPTLVDVVGALQLLVTSSIRNSSIRNSNAACRNNSTLSRRLIRASNESFASGPEDECPGSTWLIAHTRIR